MIIVLNFSKQKNRGKLDNAPLASNALKYVFNELFPTKMLSFQIQIKREPNLSLYYYAAEECHANLLFEDRKKSIEK